MALKALSASFDASTFDWSLTEKFGLLNRCMLEPKNGRPTCGKVLKWCMDKITTFREGMGIRVCVFKIGVTANPPQRYLSYLDLAFTSMWCIAVSPSSDLIHMLEAGLISHFCKHVGCRNKENSGGEGSLNKANKSPGPYYVYITGGRADQLCKVG